MTGVRQRATAYRQAQQVGHLAEPEHQSKQPLEALMRLHEIRVQFLLLLRICARAEAARDGGGGPRAAVSVRAAGMNPRGAAYLASSDVRLFCERYAICVTMCPSGNVAMGRGLCESSGFVRRSCGTAARSEARWRSARDRSDRIEVVCRHVAAAAVASEPPRAEPPALRGFTRGRHASTAAAVRAAAGQRLCTGTSGRSKPLQCALSTSRSSSDGRLRRARVKRESTITSAGRRRERLDSCNKPSTQAVVEAPLAAPIALRTRSMASSCAMNFCV